MNICKQSEWSVMEWLIIEQCYLLSILRVEYSDLYYIEMFSLAK